MKPRTHRRVQLHLDTGRTLAGVLLSHRRGFFQLADLEVEVPGENRVVQPSGVASTFVPRERVLFVTEVAS